MVGGKGTVQAALALQGHAPPQHLTLPEELWPYAGRKCWRTTPDALRAGGNFPVFVKPYMREKVFAGQVLESVEDLDELMVPRPGFPPVTTDFDILAQRPVTFLSEWKSYVMRGQTVGISHQKGDPLLFPDPQVIRDVQATYQNAPAGHGADYGVLDNGKTVLVEINDGYALGQGGLHAMVYAELLLARWDELTAQ
ncbi:ATP-grasp domain-containing protein [Deinococcus sp. Leaf326]|uniref:ATP-grasp domain-containing protein n=1 Tax=Deinococcus sp. Leaf326 TaxID=1736338 RepID=UPI001F3B34E4|nr:ATP-grasp domain-containing protein [Deinococcus sp. Leaf326]